MLIFFYYKWYVHGQSNGTAKKADFALGPQILNILSAQKFCVNIYSVLYRSIKANLHIVKAKYLHTQKN